MNIDNSTEEIIKVAARTIFTQKGLDGARMQDIADEAKVNKGLLNYYFRSKEKLFHIVFDEAFSTLFSNTALVLEMDIPLEEKISLIIKNESETIGKNPFLPLFVMNEVSRNHHLIEEKINNSPVKTIMSKFSKQVEDEVKKGKIRAVTGSELFMNITSMVMFPYIGKNLFQTVFDKSENAFDQLMEARQQQITNFILASLKP